MQKKKHIDTIHRQIDRKHKEHILIYIYMYIYISLNGKITGRNTRAIYIYLYIHKYIYIQANYRWIGLGKI
jgi:hypothetical protein